MNFCKTIVTVRSVHKEVDEGLIYTDYYFLEAILRYKKKRAVAIDIKPGSDSNSINLGSNGTVPVAILSSADFDATSVDLGSVRLAGAPVARKGKGTLMYSLEDVNGDRRTDMVVHVETEALQLSDGDTGAVLEARDIARYFLRGIDAVRIVP